MRIGFRFFIIDLDVESILKQFFLSLVLRKMFNFLFGHKLAVTILAQNEVSGSLIVTKVKYEISDYQFKIK